MTKIPLHILLFLLLPIRVISQSLNFQRSTLLSIKNQWGSPSALSSWSPATSPCSWHGIQCSTTSVTGITLFSAGINFTIPPSICDLKTLKTLNLSWNNIPGTFPTALRSCSALSVLDLSADLFVGPIPDDVDKLLPPSLQYLNLDENKFSGDIPKSIGALKELKSLYLTQNSLDGIYPSEISNLSKLEDLQMDNNPFISMALPSEWGKLKSLKVLIMSKCNLVGEIPVSFGGLESLVQLDLSGNGLVGRIPNGLFMLNALRFLYLSLNDLFGEIPSSVQALNLIEVDISYNMLSGSIPQDFGELKRLKILNLFINSLSGEIPAGIGLLPELEILNLNYNNLSGPLPRDLGLHSKFRSFEIAGNRFSGPLPENLCSRGALIVVRAFLNNLSGEIPKSLEKCTTLGTLMLYNNSFTGEIPARIWTVPALDLDLSNNKLSGSIPDEFKRLSLTFLNLSNNKLSGKIPHWLDKKVFSESFLNTNLCTTEKSPILKLPRCSTSLSTFFSKHLAIILVLAVIVLSMILYFTVVAINKAKRSNHKEEVPVPAWTFTPFQRLEFTEDNIVRNLSDQQVIGSGGSGKVYLVQVDDESGYSVAVKRIWNNQQVNNAQFLAEVEILGKIRHSNIVKLLCCISGEKTKLLVYEYMENQSLDRWLHRRRRLESENRGNPLRVLDWPMRLRIAIGAAQGLCYMHHSFGLPIIHRDVKSSNILLDTEFNAKIADFGLARMMVKQGELHTMSNVAGSFGYLAPEYQRTRKVNEKIDVYSFGVVLLELVTGKEPNSRDETLNLADSSWRHCCEDKPIVDELDEAVMQQDYLAEMTNVFKLGLMCTSPLPNSRPSMSEVLQMLRQSSPLDEAEAAELSSEQN